MNEQDIVSATMDSTSITDRRITQVIQRVHYNPSDTVCQHAADLKISPSRLEHLFKHHTGRCIREFIINTRMARAIHLLRTTNLRIKEIAGQLGYAHAPSFNRTFIIQTGKPPLHYRRNPDTPASGNELWSGDTPAAEN